MKLLASLAPLVPAITLGLGGLALLDGRTRVSGGLLLATAGGLLASAAAALGGRPELAAFLLALDVLPLAAALLAYPAPSARHWVDYCAWVVVIAGSALVVGFVTVDPAAAASVGLVVFCAVVGHGWRVLSTGEDRDRVAMLWVGAAGLVVTVAGMSIVASTPPAGWTVAVSLLPVALVGPSMAIGIRRPRLVDVRWLVVSTVVLIVLAVGYLSVFVAALVLLELLGVDDVPPVLQGALGLALATGLHPLRVVLRGLIDELMFGERPDPLVAAATVADQIGDDPLRTLRAVREALVLPYATVRVDDIELASSGTAVTDIVRLPLTAGDDVVGEVAVALRPGQVALSAEDQQVLRIVGALLTQNLRARALAAQVTESRASAITTIEDERRRLRRDLHDGLGPTLSGIAHAAAAARISISTEPATAAELLDQLRADAVAAVGEIRRLVYAMRPPALDELGLVEALHQQLGSIRTPSGLAMQVTIQSGDLPALPAAIEVAAYRIAVEAVTNAARHSGSQQAWLQVEHDEEFLVVTVRDAGSSTDPWVVGVGVASMRERAAEVGGAIRFTPGAHGSTVEARLPRRG